MVPEVLIRLTFLEARPFSRRKIFGYHTEALLHYLVTVLECREYWTVTCSISLNNTFTRTFPSLRTYHGFLLPCLTFKVPYKWTPTVTILTMPPTAPEHSWPKSTPSLQGPDLSNSSWFLCWVYSPGRKKLSDFSKKIVFFQVVLLFLQNLLTTLVTVELFFSLNSDSPISIKYSSNFLNFPFPPLGEGLPFLPTPFSSTAFSHCQPQSKHPYKKHYANAGKKDTSSLYCCLP